MLRPITTIVLLAFLSIIPAPSLGQDADTEATADERTDSETESIAETDEPAAEEGPRSMSGMSILGNEEAPKSLVIIPWKSSELGDDLDLNNSLDADPEPVDKDVFLRELRFYEIRAGQ